MVAGIATSTKRPQLAVALMLWGVLALLPMAAYAQPLWQNALADTPIAYLVWIPILGVVWGISNLATISTPYPDDRDINLIMGAGLVVLAGLLLVVGPERWPVAFVYYHGGLLVWPLWALGLAWLLFGIGVTGRLIWPSLYLWLAWPPIFAGVVNITQDVLTRWSIGVLNLLAAHVSWLKSVLPAGNFVINHGAHGVLVVVAQACSGADSLLGAAILLPLLLTVFRGPVVRLLMLVAAALVGALVINWLRLGLIVASVHWIGSGFSFGILHPILGFILFALLAVSLMAVAPRLGLAVRRGAGTLGLRVGARWLVAVAVGVSALLFVLLLPLFSIPAGALANPLPVRTTSVFQLLPRLSGFQASPRYQANESSVLGVGSYTVADLYTSPTGASALAEVWSTPDRAKLASYGFQDCLVYHGDNLVAQKSFSFGNHLLATVFAVSLPPAQLGGRRQEYVDVEWETAVKTKQGVRYLRWSVASFPGTTRGWPQVALRLGSVSGLEGLSVPPTKGTWPTSLVESRTDLQRFATALMANFDKQLGGNPG